MKLLLILLSIVTFTVESKNKVSMSGDAWPYDIQSSYACTYQAGQVRANDTATLRLSGLENIQIESVQIYMKSNQAAGAGVIKMSADGAPFYTKSGTYKDWFGSYSTDYQAIGWTGKKRLNEGSLTVEVVGTTNSLYIEKYEITWTQPVAATYNVTLMTEGVSQVLTETAPESGVVLPERSNKNGWHFAGWALEEVDKTNNQPFFLSPGTVYKPKKDMTFWAVWANVQEPTWEKHPTPESGYYTMELFGLTLTGSVNNGTVPMVDHSEMVYADDLYYIDFNTTDATCTIRNYAENSYIGFNDACTTLRAKESAWQYRMLPDSTWLFIAKEQGDKVWVLFQRDEHQEAWLSDYVLGDNPRNMWALYQLPDPNVQRYWTSHPSVDAVEITSEWVNGLKGEWVIPFGIYDLIIKDGKKYLRLKE